MNGHNVILRSNTGTAETSGIDELYESDNSTSVQACGIIDGSLVCADYWNPERGNIALNDLLTDNWTSCRVLESESATCDCSDYYCFVGSDGFAGCGTSGAM